MMTNKNASPSGGKRGLIGTLILANLLMLVIGILTIPPNLRGTEGKELLAPRAEQTALFRPAMESESVSTPAEGGESKTTEETGANLSTEERPGLEDFLWYTEDVFYNDVPGDATAITSLEEAAGGWKAMIIYDPDSAYDSNATEFLNISIADTVNGLSLTLDWHLIFWPNEGESFDETDMEDTVFYGEWESGGLWASGAGTIRLTQFYEQNQKQYAIGTMDTPDGIPAFIALTRP